MSKKKEKIPATVRNSVWVKYIGNADIPKCFCCNYERITRGNFECGHIISEKSGGLVNLENLRPICSLCNKSMGKQNMNLFMEKYGYKKNHFWNGWFETSNENINTIPFLRRLKIDVWDTYNGDRRESLCYICRQSIKIMKHEIGCLISVKNGGYIDDIRNLRPICAKCHDDINGDNMVEYIQKKYVSRLSNETSILLDVYQKSNKCDNTNYTNEGTNAETTHIEINKEVNINIPKEDKKRTPQKKILTKKNVRKNDNES